MNQRVKAFSSTIRSSEGLRHSLLMVVGTGVAMVISAMAMLIYSRVLGPVAFGEFTVGFSLMAMLARLNDVGLTLALQKFVPKAKDHQEKSRVISYATKVKLMMSGTFLVTGVILAPLIASFLRFENVRLLYVVFLLNWITIGFEHVVGVLQALRRVSQSVAASLLQALAKLAGALGLAATGLGSSFSALVLFLLAPLVSIFSLGWLFPRWLRLRLTGDFTAERNTLWKMAEHSAVYYVTLGVVDNVDVLLVQRYLTDLETGLYSGASRIGLILFLSSYALAAVLNPRAARYTKRADLRAYLKKALVFSAILIVLGVAALPLVRWVILLTVGAAYLPALGATQLLIFAGMVALATAPLMALFFSFSEGEWYFSLVGILQLVIVIGGNVVLTPLLGMNGAAFVRLGGKLMVLMVTLLMGGYYARKVLSKP